MRQSSILIGAAHTTPAVAFSVTACPTAEALIQGYYPPEPTIVEMIERMTFGELTGMLVLASLLVALVVVGLNCFLKVATAIRQTRGLNHSFSVHSEE